MIRYDDGVEVHDLDSPIRRSLLQVPAGTQVQANHVGERFIYYYVIGSTELHFVARADSGEAIDTIVETPGATGFGCFDPFHEVRPPGDKLAYVARDAELLVLVDLATPTAREVATVDVRHGGKFACPVWSPSGDELAFVEYSDALWTLYLVRWDEAGLQAPRELLQSPTEISDVLMVTP